MAAPAHTATLRRHATDWQERSAGAPRRAPAPAPITLALLGGPRLLREATASLLASLDGLQVIGAYESPAELWAAELPTPPSMVLVDCDGGAPRSWHETVAALSAERASRIVILCREVNEELIGCAVEHQVCGVILKSYTGPDIRAAIAYIATGRTVMPAGWQRLAAPPTAQPSPRQRQILSLIAEGRCNREIAGELGLSPNTIKFHVRALYARLGVRNRVEAANRHAQMSSGRR